jgi:hypothetical protein
MSLYSLVILILRYSLISACHNEELSETIYVKSYIRGPDLPGESVSRPDFKEDDFYPEISADDCYKTANQILTVIELVSLFYRVPNSEL